MNNFGLTNKIQESILEILTKYKAIKKVIIFGSRATGTYKTASDIDLAIWCDEGSEAVVSKLCNDFEESTIPYFFDIIDYQNISNSHLQHNIDKDGKILYQREE